MTKAGVWIAVVALAATGCTSSGHGPGTTPAPSGGLSSHASATGTTGVGTVAGRLLLVGGPAPGVRAASGTVRLHGATSTQGPVDRRGHFAMAVAPGTYRVTGTSPEYGDGRYVCRAARPVVVVAAETRHVDVLCQLR